jgi:hypothetical protein
MSTEKKEYPIDPVASQRFETCKLCAFYSSEEIRCNVCGCSVKKLVNDEVATCPVGKW